MRYIVLTILLAAGLSACAKPPTRTIDSQTTVRSGISEISPVAARPAVEAAYSQFVDVREPAEFAVGHAERARNIPLSTLADNLDKLERNEPVYVICQTSNRSREAAKILTNAGYEKVVVITGGTVAWNEAGLPMKTGP